MKNILPHAFSILLIFSSFCLSAQQTEQAEKSVKSAPEVTGQKFEKWSGEGSIKIEKTDSLSSPVSLPGGKDSMSVTATYSAVVPSSYLVIRVQGTGTVEPAADKRLDFTQNPAMVDIKAIPSKNTAFSKWICSGPVSVDSESSASAKAAVTGPGAKITAVFNPLSGTLSLQARGGGSVEPWTGAKVIATGTPQKIKAVASGDSKFALWEVSGDAIVSDAASAETEITLNGYNASARAVFSGWLKDIGEKTSSDPHYAKGSSAADTLAQFELAVSGKGSTSPAPGSYSGEPSKVTLKATPSGGAKFSGWKQDGKIKIETPSSPETIAFVYGGNSRATAEFIPEYAVLQLKSSEGGTVSPDTAKDIIKIVTGTETAISATPSEGYEFSSWLVVSGSAAVANPKSASTSVKLSSDASVTAVFSRNRQQVAVQEAVKPESGRELDGTIVSILPDGTVEAVPPTGYAFLSWKTEGKVSVDNKYAQKTRVIFEKGGDASNSKVTAVFVPDYTQVKIETVGSGKTVPPSGDKLFQARIGEKMNISAIPGKGSRFVCWKTTGGITVEDEKSAVTTADPVSNSILTAVFETVPVKLTVEAASGGTVSPAGVRETTSGSSVEINASPEKGFRFANWKAEGDIEIASPDKAKTSVKVSDTGKATAVFTLDKATLTIAVSGDGRTTPESCRMTDVKPGSPTKVNVIAGPEYIFSNWIGQGRIRIDDPLSSETKVTVLDGNALLVANMTRVSYGRRPSSPDSKDAANSDLSSLAVTAPAKGGKAEKDAEGGDDVLNFGVAPSYSDARDKDSWIIATDGLYIDKVRVFWRYPGASYFEVWRRNPQDKKNSQFVKLVDFLRKESYDDAAAEPGVTYEYKVVARGVRGAEISTSTDTGFRALK